MFKLIIFVFCLASCATKIEKKEVVSIKVNKKENVIELRYNNGEIKRMYNNRVV